MRCKRLVMWLCWLRMEMTCINRNKSHDNDEFINRLAIVKMRNIEQVSSFRFSREDVCERHSLHCAQHFCFHCHTKMSACIFTWLWFVFDIELKLLLHCEWTISEDLKWFLVYSIWQRIVFSGVFFQHGISRAFWKIRLLFFGDGNALKQTIKRLMHW